MLTVVILNLLIAALLVRAAYMTRLKFAEWRALPADTRESHRRLVRDHLEGWVLATIAKTLFLAGGMILLFYGDFEPRPFQATSLVVPTYILGFLVLVVRSERSIKLDDRRYELMQRENGNGS